MGDFWVGMIVGIVVGVMTLITVSCIAVGARSERPVQGCSGCDAMQRDELKKENESLRQKMTVLMAEREIGKTTEPKNTYEELERSWEKV